MSAYKKNKNGSKLWLVKNKYGAWIVQFKPTEDYVRSLLHECVADTTVYSMRVKEIERKELFSLKEKDGELFVLSQEEKDELASEARIERQLDDL